MKQFNELSKDDQRLICEVMRLQNEAALSALDGFRVDNSEEIESNFKNMSYDAKLHTIEILKNSLPEQYR